MEHVWQKIEELRAQYEVLREDRTPLDVFTFLEVDFGLDPIPFDDLTAKYRVEAAITADFSGIYLDAAQYALMERGPEWKLNRLRFTVAYELAHYSSRFRRMGDLGVSEKSIRLSVCCAITRSRRSARCKRPPVRRTTGFFLRWRPARARRSSARRSPSFISAPRTRRESLCFAPAA